MEPITSFTGDNAFLSNFWLCSITYEGITYPSSEHAYQAAKTMDKKDRLKIRNLASPGKAKRAGKDLDLRKDWENVKIQVMEDILNIKFLTSDDLSERLIATGTAQLIERNTWHDYFWGVCDGKGKNHLGRVLMRVRIRCQER